MVMVGPIPELTGTVRRSAPSTDHRPHVVIIGGGFAGLEAAKSLRKAPVRITLLDKRNFHLFQPLLYQVATANLAPAEVAYPIRAILRKQDNVSVLMSEAHAIDLDARRVTLRPRGTRLRLPRHCRWCQGELFRASPVAEGSARAQIDRGSGRYSASRTPGI